MNESPATSTSPRAFAIVIVTLVLILVVALIILFLENEPANTNVSSSNTNVPQTNTVAIPLNTNVPPPPPEPSVVTTRAGTVQEIDADGVRFTTVMYDETSGRYDTRDVLAYFAENTTFVLMDRTVLPTPPTPGQPAPIQESTPIERTDIVKGDTIEVESATNIKGQTSFDARKVTKLLLP